MKYFIIILSLIVTILLAFYFFRGCAGLASSFDGERKSNKVRLINEYYYDKNDSKIWLWEERTDSYRIASNDEVDSLGWNENYIVGYSKHSYFGIDVKTSRTLYFENRDSLTYFHVPVLRNMRER